jgi:signal transduction histidine kinase
MDQSLADFLEHNAETVISEAVEFARTIDVGRTLDDVTLRDHLPEIISTVVADLRRPQTRREEIEKSEGRAVPAAGAPISAAGTHALHRALSGYSISNLVAEYRALRASVLRKWMEVPERAARAPGEITRFNEAIDEAITESVRHYADEVERWRNLFLGVLGHDLRSPLTAILLTSESIARSVAGQPVERAAQRLVRSTEHMCDLLDKLLVYNRAQMGIAFEIRREPVDLGVACAEEIEHLRSSFPMASIRFDAEGDLQGRFDAARIREVLDNLVVNADKYGTRGGEIQVRLRGDGGKVHLSVRNAGQPIPREKLEVLFEPLIRGAVVASSDEEERTSLGLGLFIVSEIVKAHGGRIHAESDDGFTAFHIELPRH